MSPPATAISRPRAYAHNLVWDISLLAWVAMEQPIITGETITVTVGSPLTVTGPVTNTELRAAPVDVTLGALVSHVIVDSMPAGGAGLTDTELRATPVPVSGTVAATLTAGQQTMANSLSVALASDQTKPPRVSALVTLDGAADEVTLDTLNYVSGGFTLYAGTLAGTLTFTSSADGVTWGGASVIRHSTIGQISSLVLTNPSPFADGIFLLSGPQRFIRVHVSAYTSGSATIQLQAVDTISPFALGLSLGIAGLTANAFRTLIGASDTGGIARNLIAANSTPASTDYGSVVREAARGQGTAATSIPIVLASDQFPTPGATYTSQPSPLLQGVVSDTPQSYTPDTLQPISLTSEGRVRVSMVQADLTQVWQHTTEDPWVMGDPWEIESLYV